MMDKITMDVDIPISTKDKLCMDEIVQVRQKNDVSNIFKDSTVMGRPKYIGHMNAIEKDSYKYNHTSNEYKDQLVSDINDKLPTVRSLKDSIKTVSEETELIKGYDLISIDSSHKADAVPKSEMSAMFSSKPPMLEPWHLNQCSDRVRDHIMEEFHDCICGEKLFNELYRKMMLIKECNIVNEVAFSFSIAPLNKYHMHQIINQVSSPSPQYILQMHSVVKKTPTMVIGKYIPYKDGDGNTHINMRATFLYIYNTIWEELLECHVDKFMIGIYSYTNSSNNSNLYYVATIDKSKVIENSRSIGKFMELTMLLPF